MTIEIKPPHLMEFHYDVHPEDDGGLEVVLAVSTPVAPTVNTLPDLSAKSLYSPANNKMMFVPETAAHQQSQEEPQVQHHCHHMQQQPKQYHHPHPSVANNFPVAMTGNSSRTLKGSSSSLFSSAAGSADNRAQMERAQKIKEQVLQKKARGQFLLFTRVLMKYLEKKDPSMHARAKQVIRECAERNQKKEPGFESVTASMKAPLRDLVGESYWHRAEEYLTHIQAKMLTRKMANVVVGGRSSVAKGRTIDTITKLEYSESRV